MPRRRSRNRPTANVQAPHNRCRRAMRSSHRRSTTPSPRRRQPNANGRSCQRTGDRTACAAAQRAAGQPGVAAGVEPTGADVPPQRPAKRRAAPAPAGTGRPADHAETGRSAGAAASPPLTAVRAAVEAAMPQLRHALAESGINSGRAAWAASPPRNGSSRRNSRLPTAGAFQLC